MQKEALIRLSFRITPLKTTLPSGNHALPVGQVKPAACPTGLPLQLLEFRVRAIHLRGEKLIDSPLIGLLGVNLQVIPDSTNHHLTADLRSKEHAGRDDDPPLSIRLNMLGRGKETQFPVRLRSLRPKRGFVAFRDPAESVFRIEGEAVFAPTNGDDEPIAIPVRQEPAAILRGDSDAILFIDRVLGDASEDHGSCE